MELKNSSPVILALITTFGLFFCIFYMLRWGFPVENKELLAAFTQLLGTIWTLQMNFFFGSTAASKDKDETISAIAQAAPIVGTGNGIGDRATDTALPAKDVTVKTEGDVVVKKEGKNG